jgi:serine phosphatase RsbU (regulator of sigma subunit)
LEFKGSDGWVYGFFYQLPHTNLLAFAETPRAVLTAEIHKAAYPYVLILLVVLVAAAVALWYPLSRHAQRIRQLVQQARELAQGRFDARLHPPSEAGELHGLAEVFVEINEALTKNQQGARPGRVSLDSDVLRRSIERKLLPRAPIPKESGLEIATRYTPAPKATAYWYGYFFDRPTGDSVLAMAHVPEQAAQSGAMIAAILAAEFEKLKVGGLRANSVKELALQLNRVLFDLGQGEWVASLLAVRYCKSKAELELLNAGLPFPWFIAAEGSGKPNVPVAMKSTPLGAAEHFTMAHGRLPFPVKSALVLFNDGVFGKNPETVFRKITLPATQNSADLLTRVADEWAAVTPQPSSSDFCLVTMKAA